MAKMTHKKITVNKFLQRFVKEFNRTFGEPFLPSDFARAYYQGADGLTIVIGPRDSDFDHKGRRTGSGSWFAYPYEFRRRNRIPIYHLKTKKRKKK